MQLRYDDNFVEGAVFVFASRQHCGPPPLHVRRFHLAREKLYSILDPDARNTAFFDLHLEWFREWGMEKALVGPADEFPRLRTALGALVFRRARMKRDEGAELYVGAEHGRAGVVALRVERFERPEELACFLRHEFAHVNDMLDPAFGYSPELHLPGRNAAQHRLTRERYRLLWSIAIAGRLTALSHATVGSREEHRSMFDHAFGFWAESRRKEVFDSLWDNRHPRHVDLLAIASNPRGLESAHEPVPGAACPLCGFATFAWADPDGFSAQTVTAIRAEFPAWTPAQGACRRCVEIYHIVGARTPLAV
jgi:hypothetical protein